MNTGPPPINLPSRAALVWIIVAMAAYLLIRAYVYIPLKMRRRLTQSARCEYVPVEIPDIPGGASIVFHTNAPMLASLGFEAVGHVTSKNEDAKTVNYFSLWVNPAAKDHALILVVVSQSVLGPIVTSVVQFQTEFDDRAYIETNNARGLPLLRANPKGSILRLGDIWSVALLYRVHRAHVEYLRDGRTPVLDQLRDAAGIMRRERDQAYARLVASGDFVLDPSGEEYVPTLAAGFRAAYQRLFPFKQIGMFMQDRRTNKLLRVLNFGGTRGLLKLQAARDTRPELRGFSVGEADAN
jgi:hypothetical protein